MNGGNSQLEFLGGKLRQRHVWKRIFLERLTEPVHLNLLAGLVWVFGSFRAKVAFDLVLRHHHAYAILTAADCARRLGIYRIVVLELGVGSGTGLLNMAAVAERVTNDTGVSCEIYGFDSGHGMPPPQGFRDHPELFQEGDFTMDLQRLERVLPANVHLVLGDVAATVVEFREQLSARSPVGFVSIDLDYYSSTKDALRILDGPPEHYLPLTQIYLDDIEGSSYNSRCGELLAVAEFNREHTLRTIEPDPFLAKSRVFQRARWIDHMRTLHVLDHPTRSKLGHGRDPQSLVNPYIGAERGTGGLRRRRFPLRALRST